MPPILCKSAQNESKTEQYTSLLLDIEWCICTSKLLDQIWELKLFCLDGSFFSIVETWITNFSRPISNSGGSVVLLTGDNTRVGKPSGMWNVFYPAIKSFTTNEGECFKWNHVSKLPLPHCLRSRGFPKPHDCFTDLSWGRLSEGSILSFSGLSSHDWCLPTNGT